MKITLVNKLFPPHHGGVERSVELLAETLLRLDDTLEVQAIVGQNGTHFAKVERKGRLTISRASTICTISSTPIAPALPFMLRQSRADLFDFHFPYPWGELSGLLAGCRPLVVHYHSDIVRQKTLLRLYEPFLVKVLDRADKIIVESPQMRDNSKYLRCHKDKAVIIPAGIETKRFAQSPAVAERARQLRYRIAPGLGVVLFVGRFVYYKGLEHLLRAMKNVEAVLVLVGDGPLGPQLRGLSDSLGVSERVVFAGQVSDEELVAYYRMSDVLVLPSVETSETYGLVQLEAHASGIPVVSTALSTGVEFVNQQGVTGLVVPPRDAGALASAINALLTDDTLRIRMGTAARMRALRDFDIEVCARATLDVFRSMVA